MFVSSDAGNTWRQVNNRITGSEATSLSPLIAERDRMMKLNEVLNI